MPPVSRQHPSNRLAWALFASAISLFVLLSAPALSALGIPYDEPFGAIVYKLHPGTYLLLAAWAVALGGHGNPTGVLVYQLRSRPLLTAYFVCMVTVFVWAIARHGTSGAAYIVQTLWVPAIAVYTLQLLGASRRRQTLNLVMGLLACNAVLALAEYVLKARLVPIRAEQVGDAYFRATAFLGHPLLNANVTIALLPAVLLLPLALPLRTALMLLLSASVLAFGARAALVGGHLVYGAFGLLYLSNAVARGRYNYLQLTGGALALVGIASVGVAVVIATGLGDRIFENLSWDSSASVRGRVWDAFDHLRGADWWFGLAPVDIDRISLAMGIDPVYESIENFWIYAFLQFGIVGFVPYVVGLGCLSVFMLRLATPPMRLGVIVFFIVASTANALSSKTVSLTLLATVVFAGASMRAPTVRSRALRRAPLSLAAYGPSR